MIHIIEYRRRIYQNLKTHTKNGQGSVTHSNQPCIIIANFLTDKLMYLRSCLLGKAAEKIESLECTSANYQVAWSILEKCYDDPAAVINNRIRALFELAPCQNLSASALGNALDKRTKHYRALEALNKPFLEAFPIYLIVSKLDHQSRIKWKEVSQRNSSSTMSNLLEYSYSRRKVLETD